MDHIVDHLRTIKDALRNSCPVSNRRSHVSEHPFSPTSGSVSPQGTCKRGRRRFHILRHILRVMPQNPTRQLYPGRRRCGCGRRWLDQRVFSRRALGVDVDRPLVVSPDAIEDPARLSLVQKCHFRRSEKGPATNRRHFHLKHPANAKRGWLVC
jgi:hypothetical protein